MASLLLHLGPKLELQVEVHWRSRANSNITMVAERSFGRRKSR